MTEQKRTALKELQRLDDQISDARQSIRDFDPLFAEVEDPALVLESELGTTQKRLQELKLEERRLEIATEEKRARVTRLDERLGSVKNLREEAAASSELDMVKRALQSDEQEAYTVLDQIRKLEDREAECSTGLAAARAELEPRMEGLLADREKARAVLKTMEAERGVFVESMDLKEVRLYDSIRLGGRRRAVSELTEDGACGHCFGVVPLQIQHEIRHGTSLIRCEGCGVILASPTPAPETAPEAESAPAPETEPDTDSDPETEAAPPE